MAKPTKPESQMTQLEKAELAAERVRARKKQQAQNKPKETTKPAASPNVQATKPKKKPSYLENMSIEDQIKEMERMEKENKAYEESRQIVPKAYNRGGMVTARGQGKAMRTRKTRIC